MAALAIAVGDIGELGDEWIGLAGDGLARTSPSVRVSTASFQPVKRPVIRSAMTDHSLCQTPGMAMFEALRRGDAAIVPAEDDRGDVLDIIVRRRRGGRGWRARIDGVRLADEVPDEVDLVDHLLEDLAAGSARSRHQGACSALQ